MWLFEVHDDVRPGFRLILKSGEAGVPMGYDDKVKGDTWLPLGNSVEKWLRHPDDQQQEFKLLHAHLDEKNIGFCLTGQTTDEAALDERALVLIDACTDREIGVTNVAEAFGKTMPEFVLYTKGDGHSRRLYIFKPGDALFISWSAASLDSNRPKRFVISWDAEKKQLVETAVGRPRRASRPPKKQERSKHRSPAPTRELRPS
jgi:hypothetical protein